MAVKTIQIADKPTLDATKALLENGEYGLSAIKSAVASGSSGGSVGGLQIEKYTDERVNGCVSVSTLPYDFCVSSAVVLNGEIHILGSNYNLTYMKYHYKYNGSSWKSVSTLPYSFHGGSAVVLNGEIHILGGVDHGTSHYIVKNDSRRIATMLPKGIRIMLSDNEDINYVSNATKISSNIAEVSETGYVEILATLPEPDDIKGYLIFY